MSVRERWIVYPLLLMVLGLSLRDRLTGSITSPVVTTRRLISSEVLCGRFVLVDQRRRPAVLIYADEQGRPIERSLLPPVKTKPEGDAGTPPPEAEPKADPREETTDEGDAPEPTPPSPDAGDTPAEP
jgi:hypothetical protein